MSEEIQFKCDFCGREFDPDPDTMVEIQMEGTCPCCDELPEDVEVITQDRLIAMSDYELGEHGLTPEKRDALIRGEDVSFGSCICQECQDAMADDDLQERSAE